MRDLLALTRLARVPVGRLLATVALGVVAVLAGVGLMGLAGYVVSRAAEHPPVLALSVAIVGVRAFGITRPLARYGERLVAHDLAFRALARMRVAVYRRLEPQVPSRTSQRRQGDLLATLVGDVDATQDLYLRGFAPPLVALLSAVVCVLIAAVLLPSASLVLAIGLLLAGVGVPVLAARLRRPDSARQVTARAELTAQLVELLHGAPEIVAMGRVDDVLARVGRLDGELARAGRRDATSSGVVEALVVALTGLTAVTVLWVSVRSTAAGGLDRTLVAALVLGTIASFEAVVPLPAAALVLHTTAASARRLLSVAGGCPTVSTPAAPADLPRSASVAMEGVCFDDGDPDAWALHDVDLRLGEGARVALVGPSGAGKSTLAALVVRFLDPDSGSVLLGGVDETTLQPEDVRRTVTLDAQDAHLFSTSIRENVRLARPDATDADVDAALARAGLLDWVRTLPDGGDTWVGENGTAVSGGERRRIALARALLADTRVLVLDEPTAHLDHDTAQAVMADVHDATDGRSLLLITHRTEGLDRVDAVLRLTRGRLGADVDTTPG
jgi:ATP-binding cassette subfamily C protein CydC